MSELSSELKESDLTVEEYREYDWIDQHGRQRTYRISAPVKLFLYKGCTTHRIVDGDGVTHCVPGIGQMGCVLRWKSKDPSKPVSF